MDAYRIQGGYPLKGVLTVNGSKNASLPCLYASLLTSDPLVIKRVPRLRDTRTAVQLLESLGKKIIWDQEKTLIERGPLESNGHPGGPIPYELVSRMRASVLSAGPLLARWGKTVVAIPGGCSIGARPIDIHLEGFKAMGAKIKTVGGDMLISAPAQGLKPVRYRQHYPSVGATENLLMAASLVEGLTVLENCAREPEIEDLAGLLQSMGARIQGAGKSKILIRGAKRLRGSEHEVIPDRLETGSYAVFAACIPGSDLTLRDCAPGHLSAFLDKLRQTGAVVQAGKDRLRIKTSKNFRPKPVSAVTKPHPGFPTDMQPQWMALMSLASGRSVIRETVFEKRLIHAAEMSRMGADICLKGDRAFIAGKPYLTGARIMAGDIRAGAGLVACALAARGETVISRIYHIERGYEDLEQKLTSLGARIKRFTEVEYKVISRDKR